MTNPPPEPSNDSGIPDGWAPPPSPEYPPPAFDPGSYPAPNGPHQPHPRDDRAWGVPPPVPSQFTQQPYGAYGVYPHAPYGVEPLSGMPYSDKSKVAAGLLQLFLGGFGAGRFYLGHNAIAIAQLVLLILGWLTLFFLVGMFILIALGIWTLIDAIMMFTGSVTDSQGRPLRP